jgi:hypothetical protein
MTADDCKTTDISKLMPGVFDGLDKSESPFEKWLNAVCSRDSS